MRLGSLEDQPDETSNYTRYTAPPRLKFPSLPVLLQLSFCLVIKRRGPSSCGSDRVSVGLINGLPALNTISILLAKVCDDQGVPTVTQFSYLLTATYFPPETQ